VAFYFLVAASFLIISVTDLFWPNLVSKTRVPGFLRINERIRIKKLKNEAVIIN
jgi:hypothetical protein